METFFLAHPIIDGQMGAAGRCCRGEATSANQQITSSGKYECNVMQ